MNTGPGSRETHCRAAGHEPYGIQAKAEQQQQAHRHDANGQRIHQRGPSELDRDYRHERQ